MLRVYVFFDGQAVYKQAQACFDYGEADFEPVNLAKYVVALEPDREMRGFFFYTGIPSGKIMPRLSVFWNNKIKAIRTRMTKEPTLTGSPSYVYPRELLYINTGIINKKTGKPWLAGTEKGIDLRLALDAVRYARYSLYDVIIIFSQDSDLTELVSEIQDIAKSQRRGVKIESAFPYTDTPRDPSSFAPRGIRGTRYRKIKQPDYDNNLDPFTPNYWPP